MGAVDDALAVRNVIDLVDKDRAFFRQLVHNIAVMNDFTANIDWRAEGFESDFNDIDGTHHAGTKPSWFEQQNLLFTHGGVGRAVMRDGFNGNSSHISKYTNGRVKGTGEKRGLSR